MTTTMATAAERILDARGLRCPMPIIKAKQELSKLGLGEVLKVISTDRGSLLDFQGWARQNPTFALLDQSEEREESGRVLYIHRLARK